MPEKGDTALHPKPHPLEPVPKAQSPRNDGKTGCWRVGSGLKPRVHDRWPLESGYEDRKRNRGRFKDPIAGGVSDLYSGGQLDIYHFVPN